MVDESAEQQEICMDKFSFCLGGLPSRKVLSHDYQDEINSCKSLCVVEMLERVNEDALVPEGCTLRFCFVCHLPLTLLLRMSGIVPKSVAQVWMVCRCSRTVSFPSLAPGAVCDAPAPSRDAQMSGIAFELPFVQCFSVKRKCWLLQLFLTQL